MDWGNGLTHLTVLRIAVSAGNRQVKMWRNLKIGCMRLTYIRVSRAGRRFGRFALGDERKFEVTKGNG